MPVSHPVQEPRPAPRAPEKAGNWWYPILVLVPAFLALAALVATIVVPSGPEVPSIRGVRLGMSAEQVRERFEGGAPASWRTEIAGADLALIRAPGGSFDRESRFELHNGMLVAIRLDLRDDLPESSGERIAITPGSVTARSTLEPGRVALTVLARDCPTHAEEVSRILSEGL